MLITETSRGLTQFGNPRAPLSASLLRSPLCRAKPDPSALGGSDAGGERWGGPGGGGGAEGMPASTGAPCRDALRKRWTAGRRRWGGYRVLWGHRLGTWLLLVKEEWIRPWTCWLSLGGGGYSPFKADRSFIPKKKKSSPP